MDNHHTECRFGVYPGGPARTFVPWEAVPWEHPFPDYDPERHNDPPGGGSGAGAETRAQNPIGRTGLRGRGVLASYGPNPMAHAILTRFRSACGLPEFFIDGTPMVEVALVRRDTELTLPGDFVGEAESYADAAFREVSKICAEGNETLIALCRANHAVVREGYQDDKRNTDEAWIETRVLLVHDGGGCLFDDLNMKAGACWALVTPALLDVVMAPHAEIVRKVVSDILNAAAAIGEPESPLAHRPFDVPLVDIEKVKLCAGDMDLTCFHATLLSWTTFREALLEDLNLLLPLRPQTYCQAPESLKIVVRRRIMSVCRRFVEGDIAAETLAGIEDAIAFCSFNGNLLNECWEKTINVQKCW